MKKITIYQDNNESIKIEDDDDKKLNEYTNDLTKVMESNCINILNTSTCSVIIRPNKISSIVIKEIDYNEPNSPQVSVTSEKRKTNTITEGSIKNRERKITTKPIIPPPSPKPKQGTKNLEQNNENQDIITD